MLDQKVSDWQGRILGHYQFLRLLGCGGTGEVWLVVDQRDQRQLALKLLSGILVDEDESRRIFKHEARIAASLNHPHILALCDFGEDAIHENEIVCYLVMPYIAGGTLRERLLAAKGRLPILASLHYLKQAAEAIDYLHSQQVLHRDIKPTNMLLEGDRLFLADFGIARLQSSNTYRSRTYAGCGTPEYMAPEQVQRRAEAASDRYSLGIIAYQIFTGSLPFTSKDPYDVLLKQIKEPPPVPHLLNPLIPSSVASVLLRALAKQPAERYPSCFAFVTALEEVWLGQLTAETIISGSSHADTQEETDIVTMAILPDQPPLNVSLPLSSELEPPTLQMAPIHLNQITASTDNGENNVASGTTRTESVKQGKPRLRRRAVLIGGIGIVLLAAGGTTAVTLLNKPQPPGPQQFTPGKALMILSGHKDTVQNVTWDPTGRYLATASKDTHVMLWDVGDVLHKHPTSVQTMNQPTSKWKFPYDIVGNSLHWTLDGRKLIVSNSDAATFTLLDPFATQSSRQTFTNKNLGPQDLFVNYECVVPRPYSDILAAIVLASPGSINVGLWQLNKPDVPVSQLTYTVPVSQASPQVRLTAIAWSCDGLLLAGQLTTQQLVIWNAQTKAVQTTVTIPPHKGNGEVSIFKVPLAWSPTDPHILAAFDIDAIAIIDVHQSKVLYRLTTDEKEAHTPPETNDVPWFPHVISVTWSPNGRYIAASYSRSTRIHVWDLQAHTSKTDTDGRRLQQVLIPDANAASVHVSTIFDLSWSPDGRYLATSSFDFSTVIWQVDAQ